MQKKRIVFRVIGNKRVGMGHVYRSLSLAHELHEHEIFFVIDRLLVDGCVAFIGLVPRLAGLTVQPLQRGSLQGYGLGMAAGVAVLVFLALVLYETSRSAL